MACHFVYKIQFLVGFPLASNSFWNLHVWHLQYPQLLKTIYENGQQEFNSAMEIIGEVNKIWQEIPQII